MNAFSTGIDAVKEAVTPFAPEVAAEMTGIDAASIRKLVKEFCHAEKAVCYGRLGACTRNTVR